MPVIKTINNIRWRRAELKVNKAVSVFAHYGLGFSRTDGIVGNINSYSKKEQTKIKSAATTLSNYKAGYYPTKQQFNNNMAVKTSHYEPLNTANYQFAQEHVYSQTHHSGHLRAPQTFISRTCFDARIQSHPTRRLLKITPAEAQEWAAYTESLWRLDKNSKDWDQSRQNNYAQIADIALRLYLSPGEFFCVRRAYADDDTRIPGISLQLIHPYQVQSPVFATYYPVYLVDANNMTVKVTTNDFLGNLPDGNYIDSGIEYDKDGTEVAIYICPDTINDPWIRIPMMNGSFKQVLHGFIQKSPGEKRGLPESAYSWHEYMNIADMEQFELESARLNTVIAGTVTADSNANPTARNPLNALGDTKSGWANLETENGVEISPYKDPGYSVRKVTEGGFIVQNFTPGYKYQELSTSRPNINIPEYIEKLLEFLYPADFGMSVVVVKQRFDSSYNASKGAIDLSWKNGIEYYLKQFSSDFHQPNYTAWLNAKIASGIIQAQGWETALLRAAWSDMSVITPPKPSLNPLAEAEAGEKRCDNGFSNREYEAQQITGTSAEENCERLEFENTALSQSKKSLNQIQNTQNNAQNNQILDENNTNSDGNNTENGGNNE